MFQFWLLLAEDQQLILVPLHTSPNDAVAEIDALYDVYLQIIDKWGTDVRSGTWEVGDREWLIAIAWKL